MTLFDDKKILDHSSLDAVVADLNHYRLLDSSFRFRELGEGKFGIPWKLFSVDTDGQTVCLLPESPPGHLPFVSFDLKFIGGGIGQSPPYPPTGKFRTEKGTAVQIWAEPPPSASADAAQRRRLHENLRGMFA